MARSNGATADLYHEPINWRKVAGIGIPTLAAAGIATFIGVSSMKGDRVETAAREPATHVYSGPIEGTVPQGPPIVAKYDPGDINQVASTFVAYVRDGNKKGLKDVTLGNISNYGILERDDFGGFEVTGFTEREVTQLQRELALEKYGIEINKSASLDLGIRNVSDNNITGTTLGMAYSNKTKSWYVISVF